MVGIAQLAERLVVVQEVAGSSPVTHPNRLHLGIDGLFCGSIQRRQADWNGDSPGRGFAPHC